MCKLPLTLRKLAFMTTATAPGEATFCSYLSFHCGQYQGGSYCPCPSPFSRSAAALSMAIATFSNT